MTGLFDVFGYLPKKQGRNPLDMSLDQVAALLVNYNKFSESEARHVFAALLLIPGFEHLRFHPFLKVCKRNWNVSTIKYAEFWDAQQVLQKLVHKPIKWHVIEEVRERLILVCRLLLLFRSIDFSRTLRGNMYVLVRRKGQLHHQCDDVMKLGLKVISPADLVLRYVELTSGQDVPGSALLLQLHAPYGPLSSNAIGSLTKKALQKLGVDMRHFGPHSTRGAAVKMFKTLGLSSEEVCQLGKWKNLAAFSSHYLRLGACQHASQKISQIVHTVSLGQSADPDWSCTPGTKGQGGKDQEV